MEYDQMIVEAEPAVEPVVETKALTTGISQEHDSIAVRMLARATDLIKGGRLEVKSYAVKNYSWDKGEVLDLVVNESVKLSIHIGPV